MRKPLSLFRRQLPFQESLYDVLMHPLKGEVHAKRAVGFSNANPSVAIGDSSPFRGAYTTR